MADRNCLYCGVPVIGRRVQCGADVCRKAYEQVKWQRRRRVPCAACGLPTGHAAGVVESAYHRRCRPTPDHGTRGRYRDHGCRCLVCRSYISAEQRRHSAEHKARTGISYTQKARPRLGPIYCADCGRRLLVGGHGNRTCTACGKAQRDARRRAVEAAAFVAPVYRTRIFERDRWRCQLCGKKVKRDAVVPHPRAPTIDHILPLSLGGTHEPANAQLACFLCNSTKGNRLYLGRPEQLSMFG